VRATNWDEYYQNVPVFTRFTRPILHGAFLRALQRYSVPNPALVELGGAGSQVFDAVRRTLRPSKYHVVDTNLYGLEMLRPKADDGTVVLHHCDALNLQLDFPADAAFSLGLIEHFDVAGTKRIIQAHLRLLKPGGVAVITFPTPTILYRATRSAAELAGKWIFHDERPLRMEEVQAAVEQTGRIVFKRLIWPILLTQTLAVIQKD
jgi:SAM-dependent methyltransferase